jgi:hypothetical protein
MKPMFEIFDDFELATSKKERMDIIQKNLSQTLVDVLKMAYHPSYQWHIDSMPEEYKIPTDTLPGLTFHQISTELRRLYMFQKGHPTADKLTPKKRKELLIQLLESIEPREAEVVIGIFQKNLGVKGLNYKFVKEAFPQLLP